MRRLLWLGGLVAALLFMLAGPASAHPLGNFTVNSYSGLVVKSQQIHVEHIVDMAEIPTFQEEPRLKALGLPGYAAERCAAIRADLRLSIAGKPATLTVRTAAAEKRPGQAGLSTLRLTCDLTAPARLSAATSIRFSDVSYADRVGWREITAAGDGTSLSSSDVPTQSNSGRLTAYPPGVAPLDVRAASFNARPGGSALSNGSTDPGPSAVLPRGLDRATTAFLGFVGRQDLGIGVGLAAVGLALLLGALHALAPGHGKTVMAAYLVGRRGSLRTAATIGATVTFTHTAGVLALGVALSAGASLAPQRLFPLMGLVSGALLAIIGAGLLRGALKHGGFGRPHSHGEHGHSHGGHEHSHDQHAHPLAELAAPHDFAPSEKNDHHHSHHDAHDAHGHHDAHDHGHNHDGAHSPAGHAKELPREPRRRSLVAMGFAGGLVPSPSALVVLLGAIAFHRTWFGILLVTAYGAGMAATLTLAGLLLVRARGFLERRASHRGRLGVALARTLPVGTASVITLVGLGLAFRGAAAAFS